MILIDVSFNMHPHVYDPYEVIDRHKAGHGYAYAMKRHAETFIVEHIDFEGAVPHDGVEYQFFRGRKKFWHLPRSAVNFVKNKRADVILVAGLIFPLQVIYLRARVGKGPKILVQHHGERPRAGYRSMFQKIADSLVDGYLFTSHGNADEWVEQGIVNPNKCHEVLEASTFLVQKDKLMSRALLGLPEGDVFLWVGRLNKNKDPLTVLIGFDRYLEVNKDARLYMIYQETALLQEVRERIANSGRLKRAVHLVGKVAHNDLETWYSAADFYISGSHKEGSGYALLEAMACGCIPIVTDIPSYRKITGGKGYLFTPADAVSLYQVLMQQDAIPKGPKSQEIVTHFKSSLSFGNIATDILKVYGQLTEQCH